MPQKMNYCIIIHKLQEYAITQNAPTLDVIKWDFPRSKPPLYSEESPSF